MTTTDLGGGWSTPPLGVLGGMGPAATADFLMRLARLTPAERDQDHIGTVVYSDPQTPDRSDAILGVGPSPLPALLRGIEFLNGAGCGLVAIPCNTAHYWYDDLVAASDIPILHIVDATAEAVQSATGGARTVGILATDGTIRSGIYHSRLAAAGMAAIDLLDHADQTHVMLGIRAMKAGQEAEARRLLLGAGELLISRGADVLIVGCTDISAALAGIAVVGSTPMVDAAECLAAASLARLGTLSTS